MAEEDPNQGRREVELSSLVPLNLSVNPFYLTCIEVGCAYRMGKMTVIDIPYTSIKHPRKPCLPKNPKKIAEITDPFLEKKKSFDMLAQGKFASSKDVYSSQSEKAIFPNSRSTEQIPQMYSDSGPISNNLFNKLMNKPERIIKKYTPNTAQIWGQTVTLESPSHPMSEGTTPGRKEFQTSTMIQKKKDLRMVYSHQNTHNEAVSGITNKRKLHSSGMYPSRVQGKTRKENELLRLDPKRMSNKRDKLTTSPITGEREQRAKGKSEYLDNNNIDYLVHSESTLGLNSIQNPSICAIVQQLSPHIASLQNAGSHRFQGGKAEPKIKNKRGSLSARSITDAEGIYSDIGNKHNEHNEPDIDTSENSRKLPCIRSTAMLLTPSSYKKQKKLGNISSISHRVHTGEDCDKSINIIDRPKYHNATNCKPHIKRPNSRKVNAKEKDTAGRKIAIVEKKSVPKTHFTNIGTKTGCEKQRLSPTRNNDDETRMTKTNEEKFRYPEEKKNISELQVKMKENSKESQQKVIECKKILPYKNIENNSKRAGRISPKIKPNCRAMKRVKKATTNLEEERANLQSASQTPQSIIQLSVDDFTFISLVGVGCFGNVHLVENKNEHSYIPYALKILEKEYLLKTKQIKQIMSEKMILRDIDHPFIIKCHSTFQDTKNLYFLFDYISGGQLGDVIRKKLKYNVDAVKFYTAEIILVIQYLHSNIYIYIYNISIGKNIVYRDLKPDNVLVARDGHIRLIDFGFAKMLPEDNIRTHTTCGTPAYIAPEILQKTGTVHNI